MDRSPAGATKIKRILWAVNPFENQRAIRGYAVKALTQILERTDAMVQPFYLLNLMEWDEGVASRRGKIDELVQAAARALTKAIQGVYSERMLPPVILPCNSGSLKRMVDMLISYATIERVQLIVANTSGDSGLERFLHGSFTETLASRSRIPVLIVGSRAQQIHSLQHILYSFKNQTENDQSFRRVICMAQQLRAKITLVPDQESTRAKRRFEAWSRWAKGHGVSVRLQFARARGLVELAHFDQVGLVVADSFERHLVQNLPCPIWLSIRPEGRVQMPKAKVQVQALEKAELVINFFSPA